MQAIERLLRCTEGGAIVEGRWYEEQVKFKEVGRVMDSGGEMDGHSGSVTCPLTQQAGIIAACPARSVMLVLLINNSTILDDAGRLQTLVTPSETTHHHSRWLR